MKTINYPPILRLLFPDRVALSLVGCSSLLLASCGVGTTYHLSNHGALIEDRNNTNSELPGIEIKVGEPVKALTDPLFGIPPAGAGVPAVYQVRVDDTSIAMVSDLDGEEDNYGPHAYLIGLKAGVTRVHYHSYGQKSFLLKVLPRKK